MQSLESRLAASEPDRASLASTLPEASETRFRDWADRAASAEDLLDFQVMPASRGGHANGGTRLTDELHTKHDLSEGTLQTLEAEVAEDVEWLPAVAHAKKEADATSYNAAAYVCEKVGVSQGKNFVVDFVQSQYGIAHLALPSMGLHSASRRN